MVGRLSAFQARSLTCQKLERENAKDIQRIFDTIEDASKSGADKVMITLTGSKAYRNYIENLILSLGYTFGCEPATQYPFDRYFLEISW